MISTDTLTAVKEFWNTQSCGENLYLRSGEKISYELQRIKRYQLEPEILNFPEF